MSKKIENMREWLKFLSENREELTEKLKQAFELSMFDNSKWSGYYTGVELDNNSSWIINPTSQNSFSQSSWSGNSYVLHKFDCFDCTDEIDIIEACKSTNEYSDNKIVIPDNFDELEYDEKIDIFKYNGAKIWSETVQEIKDNNIFDLDTDEIIDCGIEDIKSQLEYANESW